MEAPDTLIVIASPPSMPKAVADNMSTTHGTRRSPILGVLSLFGFVAAVFTGIFMTSPIASHSEEMASFGAIAGIGFGFLAATLPVILAAVGIAREETPRWPAILGFLLSVFPGSIGFWMLWKLLKQWYVG